MAAPYRVNLAINRYRIGDLGTLRYSTRLGEIGPILRGLDRRGDLPHSACLGPCGVENCIGAPIRLVNDAIGLLIRIGDCRFGPRTRVHHNSLSLLVRLVDDVGSLRLGVLKVDLRLSPHRSLVGLISWHTRW